MDAGRCTWVGRTVAVVAMPAEQVEIAGYTCAAAG
jgi:hypothetical protein